MEKEFVYEVAFYNKWFTMGLTEKDMLELEEFFIKNPNAGDVIQGTGGAKKLRWILPDKGKQGGTRIIFVDFISY